MAMMCVFLSAPQLIITRELWSLYIPEFLTTKEERDKKAIIIIIICSVRFN